MSNLRVFFFAFAYVIWYKKNMKAYIEGKRKKT